MQKEQKEERFLDKSQDKVCCEWLATQKLSNHRTDALLSCSCCFSLLCVDCQAHQTYPNQFRAMFVLNKAVIICFHQLQMYVDHHHSNHSCLYQVPLNILSCCSSSSSSSSPLEQERKQRHVVMNHQSKKSILFFFFFTTTTTNI
mmetsp:Transcript_3899/g.5845  ORF Transcript_3899/g.5845 Transcript_3899/m.5845 type:complete len:145 (-) Transcript_3899:275-709(-)